MTSSTPQSRCSRISLKVRQVITHHLRLKQTCAVFHNMNWMCPGYFSPHTMFCIDASKDPCPDRLPPFLVNHFASCLALSASILFNRSISERVFPGIWKSAPITPIHKSGSRTLVVKFSAWCALSIPQTIISKNQHSFMKKRSTMTKIILPRLSVKYRTFSL